MGVLFLVTYSYGHWHFTLIFHSFMRYECMDYDAASFSFLCLSFAIHVGAQNTEHQPT